MFDSIKKFWYWSVIIGLIILGLALYSAFGRHQDLKQLFKLRPDRVPGGKKKPLPEQPIILDYLQIYKDRLSKLK